jgi:hypothetical protein
MMHRLGDALTGRRGRTGSPAAGAQPDCAWLLAGHERTNKYRRPRPLAQEGGGGGGNNEEAKGREPD